MMFSVVCGFRIACELVHIRMMMNTHDESSNLLAVTILLEEQKSKLEADVIIQSNAYSRSKTHLHANTPAHEPHPICIAQSFSRHAYHQLISATSTQATHDVTPANTRAGARFHRHILDLHRAVDPRARRPAYRQCLCACSGSLVCQALRTSSAGTGERGERWTGEAVGC